MNDSPTIDELLATAKDVVTRAGELLVEEYNGYFVEGKELKIETKSSEIDFLTETDGKVQEFVIGEIQKIYPEHRFIAEEKGADGLGAPDCPYTWIIDPLDGTRNFAIGRKNFGSILAVQSNNEILAGAMSLPFTGDFYEGARGKGVLVNGAPVKLRATKSMTDATISSNSIRRAIKGDDDVYYIPSPYCASLENSGCAAQEIGEVIQGMSDGVFFDGIRLWDVAAGFLMIEELGGKVRYEFQEPGNVRSGLYAVASTETIFEELCTFTFEKLPKLASIKADWDI